MPRRSRLALALSLALAPLAAGAQDSAPPADVPPAEIPRITAPEAAPPQGQGPRAQADARGLVPPPVLVVDPVRLYSESAFGRRIGREVQSRLTALEAENQRIEQELLAEEKALTERRATLSEEEFRPLARAFDEKAQRMRRQQDAKFDSVNRLFQGAPQVFLSQKVILEVLGDIMGERGAVAMLERRQVMLFVGGIDVTDAAIQRLDAEIGDGADLPLDILDSVQDAPPEGQDAPRTPSGMTLPEGGAD